MSTLIHFRTRDASFKTLCGKRGIGNATPILSAVTCRKCQASLAWDLKSAVSLELWLLEVEYGNSNQSFAFHKNASFWTFETRERAAAELKAKLKELLLSQYERLKTQLTETKAKLNELQVEVD